jgi:hypothetical protein
MNPPFSASPNIDGRMADATTRHIRSALRRLQEGGRLVVLTHASHDPTESGIASHYADLRASFVFTAVVDGRTCASRHEHRYTPDRIDRIPEAGGKGLSCAGRADTLPALLGLIDSGVPSRTAVAAAQQHPVAPSTALRATRSSNSLPPARTALQCPAQQA